jgi:hypothetical protein
MSRSARANRWVDFEHPVLDHDFIFLFLVAGLPGLRTSMEDAAAFWNAACQYVLGLLEPARSPRSEVDLRVCHVAQTPKDACKHQLAQAAVQRAYPGAPADVVEALSLAVVCMLSLAVDVITQRGDGRISRPVSPLRLCSPPSAIPDLPA